VSFVPSMSRSSVLFPQPLRPKIAVSFPAGKSADTPWSTVRVVEGRFAPLRMMSVLCVV